VLGFAVLVWLVALVVTTALFAGVVSLQSLARAVRRLRGPDVVPGSSSARAA
jgi:hypothetical protein